MNGVHPFYPFESFAGAAGSAIKLPQADSGNTTIKGDVAALHFARHGQPNGVILKTGEFIQLRPRAISQTKLEVGSKVNAVDKVRMTRRNTRLLEAHEVNGIDLRDVAATLLATAKVSASLPIALSTRTMSQYWQSPRGWSGDISVE